MKRKKKSVCDFCNIDRKFSVVLWFVVQDKANPLATVLSAAMLLKYGLGEENAAKTIESAVLDTLDRGFRTGDIYSPGNVCPI